MKDTSKFNKKPKFLNLNVLRILALPVAFFGNFAGSSNFSKSQKFFSKIPSMFWKKNQISNVLRNLANSVHSIANLQPLAIFKKSMFFSEEPNYFSAKKTQILKILRNPTFPLAFYSKFASFSNFKKFMIFFQRPIFFLLKNPKFQLWTFWKFMLFQSHSRAKLRPLVIPKKSRFFLKDASVFY